MRRRVFALVCLAGCATGGAEDPPAAADALLETATDAARDTTETGRADVATDTTSDGIFPTEDVAVDTGPVGPCETPAGTTATASGAYTSTPADAIDGKLDTLWNSGGYSGTLTLTFPKPVLFDRVRIAAMGVPACTETYTLTVGGTAVPAASRSVSTSVAWLEPISVPRATYDTLVVDVAVAASWIAVAEVRIEDTAAKCAPP